MNAKFLGGNAKLLREKTSTFFSFHAIVFPPLYPVRSSIQKYIENMGFKIILKHGKQKHLKSVEITILTHLLTKSAR